MNPRAKELVEQLRNESKHTDTTNVSLFHIRRQASAFGELLVILAEEQEKASLRMEQQTDRLVKQTDRLVVFTKGLYWFTAALLVLGVIQIVVAFVCRP